MPISYGSIIRSLTGLAGAIGFITGILVFECAPTNVYAQSQEISLIPGLNVDPVLALSRGGALARVRDISVRDPIGGSQVSFHGLPIRVFVNWEALLHPSSFSKMYAGILGGGYGWDMTSPTSASMPGTLAFVRDPLFSYVGPRGERFLILLAPTLDHMVGGIGTSTGASANNARIVAFSLAVLRALGFEASQTVAIGFSRGAEALLGTMARYGDFACTVSYVAGSYDRGLDTPTPALVQSVRGQAIVDLHVCQTGDYWARPSTSAPYIDWLDRALRSDRSPQNRLAGSLSIYPCDGHDQSLMYYIPKLIESVNAHCGA